MRIMAIRTFNVTILDYSSLALIVRLHTVRDRMCGKLLEAGHHILSCNIAVVTGAAVLFLCRVSQQDTPTARLMRLVTISAGVLRNRVLLLAVRPGITSLTVPARIRLAVGTVGPTLFLMALDAETGIDIWQYQEFAIDIIVRIMTARALHLTRPIHSDFFVQFGRNLQLPSTTRQFCVIPERHRMVMTQIRTDESPAGRDSDHPANHGDTTFAVQ